MNPATNDINLLHHFRLSLILKRELGTSSFSCGAIFLAFHILKERHPDKKVVVKHLIVATGSSAGTIRQGVDKMRKKGLIHIAQKVGRSELFDKTPEFDKLLNKAIAEATK